MTIWNTGLVLRSGNYFKPTSGRKRIIIPAYQNLWKANVRHLMLEGTSIISTDHCIGVTFEATNHPKPVSAATTVLGHRH